MGIVKMLVSLLVITVISCMVDAAYIAKSVTTKNTLPFKVKILPQFGVE